MTLSRPFSDRQWNGILSCSVAELTADGRLGGPYFAGAVLQGPHPPQRANPAAHTGRAWGARPTPLWVSCSSSTQPSRVRCAGRWPPLTAARTHSRSHAGTRSRHRRQKGPRNRRSDVQGRRERVFFTSRPPRLRLAASPPPRRAGGPLGPQGAVEVSGPTGRVTQPPRGHHPHNGLFAVNSGPLHLETLGSPNPQQLLVPLALAIVSCAHTGTLATRPTWLWPARNGTL